MNYPANTLRLARPFLMIRRPGPAGPLCAENALVRIRNGGIRFMEHKLYRSDDNRLICGVCAGLGEYFDIDPTIIRLVFAVLSVFGGSGIGLYILAVFIIPKRS
jgi:phage shock protein C